MNNIDYDLVDELAKVFAELLSKANKNGIDVEEYAERWNNALDRYEESEDKHG